MSADSLAERCDASESTIYRRVNRLEQHDLIEQRTQIDPEGNHYSVYATRLERVTVEFEDGERTVEIDRAEPETEDTADRFTRMWQDL
jgi:predicted transcriptional regulator